ncbi:hypothetical protein [Nonomuraea typhae]|uniref:Uncharacterized protein n=1 Tax=Nonomuraea typhae TaxID=2603600 RepID=A0ABW7ZC12_9ACTN
MEEGVSVLYVFGFEQTGVLLSDLYFVDPNPAKGQEGAEHGVRLEVRELDRGELKGSIYSAQPFSAGRPIWRVDLLESVAGRPGSFDRTHHHPEFTDWDPSSRVFDRELSADPLKWLAARLSEADGPLTALGGEDRAALREAVPEIVEAAGRLLERVRAGELGAAPPGAQLTNARIGWL